MQPRKKVGSFCPPPQARLATHSSRASSAPSPRCQRLPASLQLSRSAPQLLQLVPRFTLVNRCEHAVEWRQDCSSADTAMRVERLGMMPEGPSRCLIRKVPGGPKPLPTGRTGGVQVALQNSDHNASSISNRIYSSQGVCPCVLDNCSRISRHPTEPPEDRPRPPAWTLGGWPSERSTAGGSR